VPQLVSVIGVVTALLLWRGFKSKGEKEHRIQG